MLRHGFPFSTALALVFHTFLLASADDLRPWQMHEISLQAQNPLPRPYLDGLPEGGPGYVQAEFEGVSGDAQGQRLALTGFWDGGQTWKIRFAPPAAGEWTYRTVSEDPGLNQQRGRLVCVPWSDADRQANPARRGWVRVHASGDRAGRYFEYADGTPFLWIGDTWWNWTKRGIRFESFQKLADDRAAKGFTVGQLFFAGSGWGRPSSLLNREYSEPDLEHLRSVEKMIEYANEKGITVWIHGWWGGPHLKNGIGAENLRRWWRCVVHRLGAYNVVWVLAGEYNLNNYGGLGLDFWKDLGRLIDSEDPYDRLLGAHPTPPGWEGGAEAPQWSTAEVLHNEDWLDYNQSQVGHSRSRNEMIPQVIRNSYAATPPKPIVVTEPWYEFIEGHPTAQDIRFAAWSAILSGAAGHTYGGGHVWKAHVPEAPTGEDSWPMEMDFDTDTLDYPGARSMAVLSTLLHGIEWWTLEPHPEWVLDNPSTFCAADPGREYVLYLRWGGGLKMDLRAAGETDTFRCRWYDPGTGVVRKEDTVNGGAVRELRPPEDYPTVLEDRDWVLHLLKQ